MSPKEALEYLQSGGMLGFAILVIGALITQKIIVKAQMTERLEAAERDKIEALGLLRESLTADAKKQKRLEKRHRELIEAHEHPQ